MMLLPDLFSFAYVPNWYIQLDTLADMALPEPWRFRNPIYLAKNPDTPILEHRKFVKFSMKMEFPPGWAVNGIPAPSEPSWKMRNMRETYSCKRHFA